VASQVFLAPEIGGRPLSFRRNINPLWMTWWGKFRFGGANRAGRKKCSVRRGNETAAVESTWAGRANLADRCSFLSLHRASGEDGITSMAFRGRSIIASLGPQGRRLLRCLPDTFRRSVGRTAVLRPGIKNPRIVQMRTYRGLIQAYMRRLGCNPMSFRRKRTTSQKLFFNYLFSAR